MADIKKISSANPIIPHGTINANFEAMNNQIELMAGGDYASKISDLQNAVSEAVSQNGFSWSQISGKPSAYTPSKHTQSINTITGLSDILENVSPTIDGGKANSIYTINQVIDCGGANG